jgi:hypothetical protein
MAVLKALKSIGPVVGEWLAANLRDFLFLGGMVMLWYGLNLYQPWIAYTVCGTILAGIGIAGYFMGDK